MHIFGPLAHDVAGPDGDLRVPVVIRGSDGVPDGPFDPGLDEAEAALRSKREDRYHSLFAEVARCIGNDPVPVSDALLRMSVDSDWGAE